MPTEATGMPAEFDPATIFANLKEERARQAKLPTIGQRFVVPREGLSLTGLPKEGVNTILYYPAEGIKRPEKLPVMFNMHGGAWIGGDAILMESFCQQLADEVPCMVVNVNYRKADEKPFPWQPEEVLDCILYMRDHAEEYGIDPAKMGTGGHSAGAHLAAGAALMAKEAGIDLAVQMLVYPCVQMAPERKENGEPSELDGLMGMLSQLMFQGAAGDYAIDGKYASPLLAGDEVLKGSAPCIFVECGPDDLKPQGIAYAKRMIDLAVPVRIREFAGAEHGFLEVNRPEYPDEDPRKRPDQAALARECEQYLIAELRACYYA